MFGFFVKAVGRRARAVSLLVVAGFAAAAGTPVTFQLNWMAGGPNAGFAAAVAEGYYRDAGLDVTLVQGNGSGNTAQLVASGRSQLAYADAVAVSQLIAKGAPMRVVSTVYQSNPNAVMALKKRASRRSAISRARKSGSIGVLTDDDASAASQVQQLEGVGHQHDRHARCVDGAGASARTGRCVLGSIDAYQIQAEAQGAQLDVYRFADYGVPTVSTSIFASNDYLKNNPDVVKKFIAASLKGWSFAMDNPDKAVKD